MHRGRGHHAHVEQLVRVEGQVERARPPALRHAQRIRRRAQLPLAQQAALHLGQLAPGQHQVSRLAASALACSVHRLGAQM